MRLRAPIWADRAAAKPFSGERDTTDLGENRRHPLKGNPLGSLRQRLHEKSGLGGGPGQKHASSASACARFRSPMTAFIQGESRNTVLFSPPTWRMRRIVSDWTYRS